MYIISNYEFDFLTGQIFNIISNYQNLFKDLMKKSNLRSGNYAYDAKKNL